MKSFGLLLCKMGLHSFEKVPKIIVEHEPKLGFWGMQGFHIIEEGNSFCTRNCGAHIQVWKEPESRVAWEEITEKLRKGFIVPMPKGASIEHLKTD